MQHKVRKQFVFEYRITATVLFYVSGLSSPLDKSNINIKSVFIRTFLVLVVSLTNILLSTKLGNLVKNYILESWRPVELNQSSETLLNSRRDFVKGFRHRSKSSLLLVNKCMERPILFRDLCYVYIRMKFRIVYCGCKLGNLVKNLHFWVVTACRIESE